MTMTGETYGIIEKLLKFKLIIPMSIDFFEILDFSPFGRRALVRFAQDDNAVMYSWAGRPLPLQH